MEIDPQSLDNRTRYKLLIASVIPRPIAWISTLSQGGLVNLAPFSFFGAVAAQPPTVMVSVGRRGGRRKDTAQNLDDTGEAVVHIAHRALADKMVATSAEVGPEVDELSLVGLTAVPSVIVKPPRVAEAAIAMESKVSGHQKIGDTPMDLFLLEVLRFHLDETYLTDGLPDAAGLAAMGRLGGQEYCDTGEAFEIPRPT